MHQVEVVAPNYLNLIISFSFNFQAPVYLINTTVSMHGASPRLPFVDSSTFVKLMDKQYCILSNGTGKDCLAAIWLWHFYGSFYCDFQIMQHHWRHDPWCRTISPSGDGAGARGERVMGVYRILTCFWSTVFPVLAFSTLKYSNDSIYSRFEILQFSPRYYLKDV